MSDDIYRTPGGSTIHTGPVPDEERIFAAMDEMLAAVRWDPPVCGKRPPVLALLPYWIQVRDRTGRYANAVRYWNLRARGRA